MEGASSGFSPRRRYLFVNENVGGHATVHVNLREALAERPDVDVDVVDVPPARGLRWLGGAAVPGLSRLDLDLKPLRTQLLVSWWVRRRLRRGAGGYDALHLYTQNTALLSAGIMRRVPTVITSDSTNALNAYRIPSRRPTRFTRYTVRIGRFWDQRAYRAARVLVSNSRWAAGSLEADYGVPAGKVRVIPFGIVVPDLPAPQRQGRTRPTIAFVGTTMARKGGDALLRLHQQHWRDRCDLLLITHEDVGPHPGVRVVNDLQPGDGRLWQLLGESDIFAFPSTIDQAPNAVLEAMAASLPVIACRVAALPEMVVDGITGLLVDPGDDDALRRAVERLLDDPEGRACMGRAGRERVECTYDIRRSADRILALLGEVSAGPSDGRPDAP